MARKKQVELNLKQKLEVLKYAKDHGERNTALKFSISKTTVNNIKKNEYELSKRFTTENHKMKRKHRKTRYNEVNDLTISWFHKMRAVDLRISGPMLQEVALQIAEKKSLPEFKASNGWLESFKKRHKMKEYTLSGESNDIDQEVVQQFKDNIQTFVTGFSPENIFNADECGLFFKAMPDKTLAIKGDKCKSGKKSKMRVTVMLAASATGEKLKPLVIGKSLKPRCFKNVKLNELPVTYKANTKSWMTSVIFESWVNSVNDQMKKENRKILLIVDNCPAHPEIEDLSNVSLKFLPPNTTSMNQPLDQGIIKNFKLFYRKLLLKMVISKADLGEKASIIANSVNVLDAVKWVAEAWDSVKVETIQNCFRKAGFIFTETGGESTNIEEGIIEEPPIQMDGIEYNMKDFVSCDDHITFTKEFDEHELLKIVLEGQDDQWDEEDRIPLAILRSKILGSTTATREENTQHSTEPSTAVKDLCFSRDHTVDVHSSLPSTSMSVRYNSHDHYNDEPLPTNMMKLDDVSNMLKDILNFSRASMPAISTPISEAWEMVTQKLDKVATQGM